MKRAFRFLRVHPFYTTSIVLLLSLGSFTVAQIVQPAPAPSHFFPDGAIVYLQTKDLQALVNSWNNSSVKQDWEASRNHEQFVNSRIYLKLQDRISKWGANGKFTFTWQNLARSAGTTTGLAIYDIGELKAIAATQIPFSKAKATQLWIARSRFAQKKSGSQTYYVEPREGILAFAYVEPYLIVSTQEDLLRQSLENFQQPSRTLDVSEKWQACQRESSSDASLFIDQEALQKNRHFNRYWIHKNTKDFADIRATWIDLLLKPEGFEERRFFANSAGTKPTDELQIQDFVQPFRNYRHDTLYFNGFPNASAVSQHILKMINKFAESYQKTSYPPTFSGSSERAIQADQQNILLEQIDEPILQVKSETLLQATETEELAKLVALAEPAAEIRLAYPLWDNQALFARFPETVIVQLNKFAALDQQKFLGLVLQHHLLLHSTQDQGGRWKSEGNGNYTLQSMHPVYVRFQDPWIVISNEQTDFAQIALPSNLQPPSGTYAEVNWTSSRWKYKRLMAHLDHGETGDEDAPLLFSENIASLLDALEPVTESSLEKFGNREIVKYELTK